MLCVIICHPLPRRSSGKPLHRPPRAPPRPARSSGFRRVPRPASVPSKRDSTGASGERVERAGSWVPCPLRGRDEAASQSEAWRG